MGHWVHTILELTASPAGVFLLASLDSTIFVVLPFGLDLAVIGLAAQNRPWVWSVPLLALAGSLVGGALTYWMGTAVGEAGLARFASPRRLERMRARAAHMNPVMLGAFHLMPPPFPFTLFVLVAGAVRIPWPLFFGTMVGCRLARFGIETALASRYGQQVATWMTSDSVTRVMQWLIVGCVVATALTLVRLLRSSPQRSQDTSRQEREPAVAVAPAPVVDAIGQDVRVQRAGD